MSKQPESNIVFELYEDGNNFMGLTQATLPNIAFIIQQIQGAGINGNIDVPIAGMMEAMELALNWRSPTEAAKSLATPKSHHLDLRVAHQYWDTTASEYGIEADKYVMVCRPKAMNPGNIQPATPADSANTFSVVYYAGYRDGTKIWEIDPFNYICTINGVDYFAPIRKALGK
jgi:P2 family phage contractile tail tube protein